MEKYDLTNKTDLRRAAKELGGVGYATSIILSRGISLFDKVFSTDTIKLQKETAEGLIKEGKNNGVDEMEITINNTRGVKLNIPYEGLKVDTVIGADEKMHIKVKYK